MLYLCALDCAHLHAVFVGSMAVDVPAEYSISMSVWHYEYSVRTEYYLQDNILNTWLLILRLVL